MVKDKHAGIFFNTKYLFFVSFKWKNSVFNVLKRTSSKQVRFIRKVSSWQTAVEWSHIYMVVIKAAFLFIPPHSIWQQKDITATLNVMNNVLVTLSGGGKRGPHSDRWQMAGGTWDLSHLWQALLWTAFMAAGVGKWGVVTYRSYSNTDRSYVTETGLSGARTILTMTWLISPFSFPYFPFRTTCLCLYINSSLTQVCHSQADCSVKSLAR